MAARPEHRVGEGDFDGRRFSRRLFRAVSSFWLMLGLWFSSSAAWAHEIRIAVAANFTLPAKKIADAFQQRTGHRIVFEFESTGKLYSQIAKGERFQAFLAADEERPKQAIEAGLAVDGSAFTYATGRLALYSANEGFLDDAESVLKAGEFDRIVIANPSVAPYGRASIEVLESLGVEKLLEPKIIKGDTVNKTLQFISSGAAELGFVALSQVIARKGGSFWPVPTELYEPIRQTAVLLQPGKGDPKVADFLKFLKGSEARAVMDRYGYGEPG